MEKTGMDVMSHNTILQGDCLDLLNRLPNESVDLVVVDPPRKLKTKIQAGTTGATSYWEWCQEWLAEIVRVTKPTGNILIYGQPHRLLQYAAMLREKTVFRHWIVWDTLSAPLGKSLPPSHSGFLHVAKDKTLNTFFELRAPHKRCRSCKVLSKDYGGKKALLHPFGPLVTDVWTDIPRLRNHFQSTELSEKLPQLLWERVILMTTNEGDLVLDPFAGSGGTLLAAKRLGRSFLGLEQDADVLAQATERLAGAQVDAKIRGAWVSQHGSQLITIRDVDWPKLAAHFFIPDPIADLETAPLMPKTKLSRKRPKPLSSSEDSLFFQLDGKAVTQPRKRKNTPLK
ncbi:MAG: site-specific DNA-methyltransferase [Blastocatellia bacterium]|nr:site-specific DNA-methyltransferase [Blastocatellia bacterium]